MLANHPVHVEVTSPARFDRLQLLLRLGVAVVLAWIGITAGALVAFLFLALPVIAALALTDPDRARFSRDVEPREWRVLRWLLRFCAYMMLLVDRFPVDETDDDASVTLTYTGEPTCGSALARLATSIPSGFVLAMLWMVGGVLWWIAAASVLFTECVPQWILAYQRGVLRWNARLVAYHASLVAEYPPFLLETEGAATAVRV
jgi:hypothetical protein